MGDSGHEIYTLTTRRCSIKPSVLRSEIREDSLGNNTSCCNVSETCKNVHCRLIYSPLSVHLKMGVGGGSRGRGHGFGPIAAM